MLLPAPAIVTTSPIATSGICTTSFRAGPRGTTRARISKNRLTDTPRSEARSPRAAIVCCPILSGGGTRIKIFEAMAMQKPIVSTTLGAEGLRVTSGEHLILADDPASFAAAVVDLLNNEAKRRTLAKQARQLVEAEFSAETIARQFERICLDTVEAKARSLSPVQ